MKINVVTIPVGEVLKNRCSSADRDMNNATWPAYEQKTPQGRGKEVLISRSRKKKKLWCV